MPKTKLTTPVERASNAHILTETICTINDACKTIPTRPCFATVWRWGTRGCRGHKLEMYRIGSQLVTSHEALHRFLEAIQEGGAK
jgi:hypothetical protein